MMHRRWSGRQVDYPCKQHSFEADDLIKDRSGQKGFFCGLQTRYIQAWTALQLLLWCTLVAAVGVFVHQFFQQATAIATHAATGVTFLGSWASLAYLCRGLQKCLELVPADSPAALTNGFVMDFIYPPTPAAPVASTVVLDFIMDPRHATAVMGVLASVMGCFKHG